MEYPSGLSITDAKKLIVNAEQRIFKGTAKSGWTDGPIRQCVTCRTQFNSNYFHQCPLCSIRNAKQIELENTNQPSNNTKMYFMLVVKYILFTLLLLFFICKVIAS